MMVVRRVLGTLGTIAACTALLFEPGFAQKPNAPAAAGPERTRQILVTNAHALESRGRPDMAIQLWQQILLSDPKNPEALAGLARDYKLSGQAKEADAALDKLRAANPNDPNISKIQALTSTRTQSDRLRQAGELARQGKNDDAMRIYRELYGDRPPDGDIALAYYQTLYGTASGKEQAVTAMRALAARNPGDPRYSVELGTMLTYDARTREEGIKILQTHPQDPNARQALRQALIWNSANPASAAQLRQYLKDHPQDTEIAGRLKEDESKLAQMNSGIARTPAERAAFAALNAHHLDDAQARFMDLLQKDPNNGRVAAGMGFLRMQQNNFSGAISYLTQAEANGYKPAVVENALATSRFWYTMGEASQAFDENQFDVAGQKYREALAMRPRSLEALNGLAGLLVKEQQFTQAVPVYEQILKIQPRDQNAWRGLFLAYARDGQSAKALATANRFPPTVKTAMTRDPDYLRTLATIYKAQGRSADAQRVLSQALALPFPENGVHLKEDTRLQYAGILMESRRFDQAAAMYDNILQEDGNNLSAWMGLVSAHHQMNLDNEAINDVEKMPPATYEASLNDPGFLSMLGSIYQQANQPDIAQGLLERSAKLQIAAGGQPSVPLQLQLAAIYLQRNNTAQAYAIYRQVLTAHPDRLDAWKGLIATLQATNHTNEALQELAYIPTAVRQQLDQDPEFVQSEASLYASAGDVPHATEYMNRVIRHYAETRTLMPADLAIQNAWILYNTRNDRALYPALMNLGGRKDLTVAQRETIQTIWANWAVRRAGTAIDNDDNNRAVEILEAAAAAFPDNVEVRRVLAGGYLKTGETRLALNIYKSLPTQDASATDFQGAIGAALAANDKAQAETWLREALERYPQDYKILGLAARFEQARGDNQRAADFWRASIAAMPQGTPTDRLAHDLAYPDVNTKPHTARTAGDLARLLDPAYAAATEPFPKTVKLPPLPAYGPDPYLGQAPVIVGNQQNTIARQTELPTAPSTTRIPVSQSATQQPPASANPTTPTLQKRRRKSSNNGAQNSGYTGQMNLPPAEENITNTDVNPPATSRAPEPSQAAPAQPVWIPTPQNNDTLPPLQTQPQSSQPQQAAPQLRPTAPAIEVPVTPPQQQQVPPLYIPQPQSQNRAPDAGTQPALRISPQPMNGNAAQVQAQFADQIDGQLTQGSASQIRNLGNAPITLPSNPSPGQQTASSTSAVHPVWSDTQYTPSAQEAATGAYSAQKPQNQTRRQQQEPAPAPAQPAPVQQNAPQSTQPNATGTTPKRKSRQGTASVPTLVTAPHEDNGQVQAPEPQPEQENPAQAQPGISDEELQQRNLPPLRGPWVRVRREAQPLNPRDEAEQQLRSLESGYSGWMGGDGSFNYRSGDIGFDRLASLEAPFEFSAPLGYHARFTMLAKPVFLDSGQADGNSVITVQESTTSGRTLVTIPQPLGTDVNTGSAVGSTAAIITPPQQNASGIGGELQLAFPQLSLAAGYTPFGFLVANWTARANWRPGNGPFTFTFSRDSVKDTQLSYAGLRDPGSASLSFPGTIWGGVVANQGNVQYARGDAMSGFYVGFGGQYLTGYQVESNSRFDGTGGAYWRIKSFPEYGNLSIGANFFGMHYAHNEQAFTFGMGGYFSPQAYFLANVPVTWAGHYMTHWHYEVLTGLGVQAFQQDSASLFPLAAQKASEIGLNNAALPALTSVGANYNLRGNVSYQIGPHWFAGGFFSANNSRNYATVSAGFSIHYMFRSQPSAVLAPTGLFPSDGLRPFTVP
ncbi:tetratricopeptide repeat protein [Acidobacteria bacterium AB60]|nr:tetratricopeptide repeat protein [Acidobacteria bacterium AB60]